MFSNGVGHIFPDAIAQIKSVDQSNDQISSCLISMIAIDAGILDSSEVEGVMKPFHQVQLIPFADDD